MAVIFPGKFVYLCTPHTATISTTAALAEIDGAYFTSINETKKLKPDYQLARGTHHSTFAELQAQYPSLAPTCSLAATTTRSPYAMSVTWWLRQKVPLAKKLQIEEPTFEEYITKYCGEGGPYIKGGKIFWLDANVWILNYETLQSDLNQLLKSFDLPTVVLPKHNVSGKKLSTLEYHTPATLKYMREHFGEEIAAHGYEVL